MVYNALNMSHIPFDAMDLCILSQNQDARTDNTMGLRMKTESDADHVFFVFPRDLVLFLCIIMR